MVVSKMPELRAALILAGRGIRQSSFGRKNDPVLRKLREVLREARRVRKESPGGVLTDQG